VLRSENADQIARFTADRTAWYCEDMAHWPIGAEGDGFFLAQLKCQAGQNVQP
jgi:hypothetical protein